MTVGVGVPVVGRIDGAASVGADERVTGRSRLPGLPGNQLVLPQCDGPLSRGPMPLGRLLDMRIVLDEAPEDPLAVARVSDRVGDVLVTEEGKMVGPGRH